MINYSKAEKDSIEVVMCAYERHCYFWTHDMYSLQLQWLMQKLNFEYAHDCYANFNATLSWVELSWVIRKHLHGTYQDLYKQRKEIIT